MKVKDLIKNLKDLNPDAKVVLGSDYELNHLYPNIFVEALEFHSGDKNGDIDLSPDNVKDIKTIVISGKGSYYLEKRLILLKE